MPLDRLQEAQAIPYDRDAIVAGGEKAADYFRELTTILAQDQLQTVRRYLNAFLETNTVDYIYFAQPHPETGLYPAGTWRIGVSDTGSFVCQKYVDDVWTTILEDDA